MSKQYEVYFFKKAKFEPSNETEIIEEGVEAEPILAVEIGFFDKAITPPLIEYVDANITPVNCVDDVFLDKTGLKKMLDHFKTIEADSSIKEFLRATYKTFDFKNSLLIFRAW